MSFECVNIVHGPDVIHFEHLVSRSRDHQITVWAPFACLDRVLVTMAVCQSLSIGAKKSLSQTVTLTHNVPRVVLLLGSQNLTKLSLLPETIKPLVWCQSTHLTSQP